MIYTYGIGIARDLDIRRVGTSEDPYKVYIYNGLTAVSNDEILEGIESGNPPRNKVGNDILELDGYKIGNIANMFVKILQGDEKLFLEKIAYKEPEHNEIKYFEFDGTSFENSTLTIKLSDRNGIKRSIICQDPKCFYENIKCSEILEKKQQLMGMKNLVDQIYKVEECTELEKFKSEEKKTTKKMTLDEFKKQKIKIGKYEFNMGATVEEIIDMLISKGEIKSERSFNFYEVEGLNINNCRILKVNRSEGEVFVFYNSMSAIRDLTEIWKKTKEIKDVVEKAKREEYKKLKNAEYKGENKEQYLKIITYGGMDFDDFLNRKVCFAGNQGISHGDILKLKNDKEFIALCNIIEGAKKGKTNEEIKKELDGIFSKPDSSEDDDEICFYYLQDEDIATLKKFKIYEIGVKKYLVTRPLDNIQDIETLEKVFSGNYIKCENNKLNYKFLQEMGGTPVSKLDNARSSDHISYKMKLIVDISRTIKQNKNEDKLTIVKALIKQSWDSNDLPGRAVSSCLDQLASLGIITKAEVETLMSDLETVLK